MGLKRINAVLLAASLAFLVSGCDLLLQKANSLLETTVTISGTVSLPASATAGKVVFVGLSKAPFSAPSDVNSWAKYYPYTIAPGGNAPFSFIDVVAGRYVVCAFYDLNGNYVYDAGEPAGGYPPPNGGLLFDFSSDFNQANVAIVANDVAPAVGLSSNSQSFFASAGGADPAAASIAVSNSGGGILDSLTSNITYVIGGGWLTATLDKTTAPATLSLQARTGVLAAGNYMASVEVTSGALGAASGTIDVFFSVSAQGQAPSIWLLPSNVSFTTSSGAGSPAAQTVSINNSGGGTVSGLTASVDYGATTGWLTATLDGTTAPATLSLQPSTGSLPLGTYSATVIVSSTSAGTTPQNVNVSLSVTQPPIIDLAPTTLSLYAVAGGANPAGSPVDIANLGGGTLSGLSATISYGAGGASGWLSASVPSSAPGVMVVQAATGTLAAGSYSATVTVASSLTGVSSQELAVTFTVTTPSQPPAIGLEKSALVFSAVSGAADPPAQSLVVSNAGGGTLSGLSSSVAYISGSGWLTAYLSSDTASPTATLNLQPSLVTLAAGSYSAQVFVNSNLPGVAPQTINVAFVVAPPPAVITFGSFPAPFVATEGGANPAAQLVDVMNTGGGTLTDLSATITYGAGSGWLSATLNTANPALLTLQPSTLNLVAGTYSAAVKVSSSAAGVTPQILNITFTVAQRPSISLSSTSLGFSAISGVSGGAGLNPSARSVAISNSGGTLTPLTGLTVGDIAYTNGSGWLAATLDTTSAPAILTVSPTTGTLAAGTYAATVPISSAVAGNSPQNLAISFTVVAGILPPAISLSQGSLGFSGTVGDLTNPEAKSVAISNSGNGTLSGLSVAVSYGSGSSWLSASLGGATLAPATLTVTPALGGLAAGTYSAQVTVSSSLSGVAAQIISVTFTVAPQPPSIQLATTSLSFSAYSGGSQPAVKTLGISNGGGGSLTQLAASVTYSGTANWLNFSLNTTAAPATLTVQPTAASTSLAIGIYTATIEISSPVASNVAPPITVSYVVAATPVTGVTVAPTSLTLSAVGATTTLTPTVLPTNATDKAVTWASSDEAVATVSASGVVTAVEGGSATITVTTTDGAFTATSSVSIVIPVTGLSLSPTTLTLNALGATSTLTATVSPTNATNKAVTWTSSNSAVAAVSASGVVSAVAAGSATITATTADGGFAATCGVTVVIPATGVSLSPTTLTLNGIGSTSTLTPTVLPSNATNKAVSWTTGNSAVATVSSSGVVSAVAVGSVIITATTVDGGFTATCAVTVSIPVTGVSLYPTTLTLNGIGSTSTLTPTVLPTNATNKTVTWSTSNSAVATVSSPGIVGAVAAGSATITVKTTDGNFTATCAVTVVIPVTGVSLSPTTVSLTAVGATSTLTATVSPTNATNKAVTWTSSNSAVATVSSTGVVTAVAAGSATVTVTTTDGIFIATCGVTVTASPQYSKTILGISGNFTGAAISGDGQRMAVADRNSGSGGYISISSNGGTTWTQCTSAGSRNWYGIAMSSNGQYLVACANGGYVYKSTNYGTSWTQTGAISGTWWSCQISDDGTTLAAAIYNGPIYTSTNGGTSWTAASSPGNHTWAMPMGMSRDGTTIAVADSASTSSRIYLSTNRGVSWTMGGQAGYWHSVFVQGSKIVATTYNGSYVYLSNNTGSSWTPITAMTSTFWSNAVISLDGSTIIATDYTGSAVWRSSDGGSTWSKQTNLNGIQSQAPLAVNGNGSVMIIAPSIGSLVKGN